MASSTPPPRCPLTTTTQKPYPATNHRRFQPQQPPHHHNQATQSHWSSQKVSFNPASQSPRRNVVRPSPASSSAVPPLPVPGTGLAPEFSGQRSTRFVSKMHFGRPKAAAFGRHSAMAEEVLQQAVSMRSVDRVLVDFAPKLCGSDDYKFLLQEFGNRGEWEMSMRCFDFAIGREWRAKEQGKLASSMISTLGRLGKIELAEKVFENAVKEGYGNTVYAYSSIISAYAKSGYREEAIRVFETMKSLGLKPNIVTYNALIDACGKGGADFKRASEVFNEMLRNGVEPDRITYNSLLAVCSGAGLWDTARCLFSEMVYKGIQQDIYTYNTLLDAACNGGYMDAAFETMAEMPLKNVFPNEVTYSTMIRGCAKAGKLDRALGLFNEMKSAGINLDRVSYNTVLAIYASLGRFDEALRIGEEMESIGIKKDVVTYNALIDGFGKQGRYLKVKELFKKMKAENLSPNLLTYSTLMSVYSKGGLYKEAMEVYREFKHHGLKADVVFYSKLIDALCKNGLVESSVVLLDEMVKEGIKPNVVTYNSIINAFNWSLVGDYAGSELTKSLVSTASTDVVESLPEEKDNDKVIKIFEQLATGKIAANDKLNRERQDFLCILGVFQKMHEMEIKPNVVTFSAILNACSHCNSFEEASLLLEELRLFDNQVYGVAYGLLMGSHENVWIQALSLFDDVKQMDSSTASAFYNALTDMLWHFGQRRGAQLVVLEGKRRQVWDATWSESCLDLHLMSSGAARAMVHAWLLSIRSIIFQGQELPKLLSILTGWGKHSKVVGDGTLKRAIEALLIGIGAPFRVANCNIGRFISTGAMVTAWLRESGTLKVLILEDDRIHPESSRRGCMPSLQTLPL